MINFRKVYHYYLNKSSNSKYSIINLFLIAFFFRIPGVNRVLIMDEAMAVETTTKSLKGIISMLIQNSQPPLFFFFLKLWSYICPDAWFLRLMPVIFGAFTCILLYKTAEILFNKQIAGYTFIFSVLSPQLIFNSQYLRPYILATFFTIFLIYIFIRFIKDSNKLILYSGLLSLMTTLCLYSFYFSFFIIFAINLFAICFLKTQRPKLSALIISQAIAIALFSIWLPIFFTQRNLIKNDITCHQQAISNMKLGFYIGRIHLGNLMRIILAYCNFDDILGHAKRYSDYIKYKELFAVATLLFLIPVFFLIRKSIKLMFKIENIKNISILILLLVFLPPLFFVIFSIGGDLKLWEHIVVNMRYFSQSSIFFLILIAIFLANVYRRLYRRILFSFVIFSFFLLDLHIYQYPANLSKSINSYIYNKQRDCKVIVICPPNALAFLNILPTGFQIFKYSSDDSENNEVKEIIKKNDKLYLYYFKSATNMILNPDIYDNFKKYVEKMGFKEKEKKIIGDIISISYFEKPQ